MHCPFALHVRQGMSNTSFPGNNLTEATSEASEQLGFNLLHTSASSESSALGILCNQLVKEIPANQCIAGSWGFDSLGVTGVSLAARSIGRDKEKSATAFPHKVGPPLSQRFLSSKTQQFTKALDAEKRVAWRCHRGPKESLPSGYD